MTITPDWPAPARVHAFATTAQFGDVRERRLEHFVPAKPAWLKQVHGKRVVDLDSSAEREGDASLTRKANTVCAVRMADCMPVLFADEEGSTVAAAHAGWRGLSGGVLEATIEAMRIPPHKLFAWLGPAIGPRVYEVGDEVRAAFRGYESALQPTRPGHWLLDLYAVARAKLSGLKAVSGGGFCTYSDNRFHSYRRDRTAARMAAVIWLGP